MPNNNMTFEDVAPALLLGGAGLLMILQGGRKKQPPPPPQELVCALPSQVFSDLDVQVVGPNCQLAATPEGQQIGRQPELWHPTAIFRFYAATDTQRAAFFAAPVAAQEIMMRMTPEEAVCFTCLACHEIGCPQ